MTLMKRNGNWPLLSGLFDDEFMTDFYGGNANANFNPAVNISEDEKNYKLELAVPGMKKKDFKVNLDNDQLTISAERSEENEEKEKNYTRREFRSASFRRSFTLPENAVDEDKIEAKYEDGVLHINIPKKEVEQPASKMIEIS